MKNQKLILLIIVVAQFFCTSLWFAGNAVLSSLIALFNLPETALTWLTLSVQLGFVCGTLVFAFAGWSDKYAAKNVFFISALLGATANGLLLYAHSLNDLMLFRFLTGFFLAGIYPVGIKLAALHFEKKMGKAIGLLVGALVLGTALPHLINWLTTSLSWKWVIATTSTLAILGGVAVLLGLPETKSKSSSKFQVQNIFKIFTEKKLRSPAFAYFGHMWELYSFWAFLPVILFWYFQKNGLPVHQVALYSFIIIAAGSVSSIFSGFIAEKIGKEQTAFLSLFCSCVCGLLSPIVFYYANFYVLLFFLLIWGFTVISDSPMLSSLVAENAESTAQGSIITLVNSIGFLTTLASLYFVGFIKTLLPLHLILLCLTIGPFFGLYFLYKIKKEL